MFTFRYLVRSLPRVAIRATRPIAPRATTFLAPKPISVSKAFSTSIWRREPAGEYDQELSAKLNQERQLELESESNDSFKAEIDTFLASNSFSVEDKPGTHQVILSKKFGNETIKIEFSVADMNEIEDGDFDPLEQDNAFGDEELEPSTATGGKRTINQSGVKGGKVDVAPEDSIAPSDGDGPFDEPEIPESYPLHLDITITKPNQGATLIQAVAQSGAIEVAQISYYPKADLVEPKTPDDVREAQTIYEGPSFTSLDTELQTMILQYLEDRGINTELAEFLPQYIDYKEQREYVHWLDNLKKFVDA